MKAGKVSEAVLKRSVIKTVNKQEKQNATNGILENKKPSRKPAFLKYY